jgi:hypothetical protein
MSKTRLLHVSDIHFRWPQCRLEGDPDRFIRTELINDARDLVQDLGPIHVILVGGDIAFQARSEEYDYARDWLLELASEVGCDPKNILTVPGNHDIIRDVVRTNLLTQDAQNAVRSANPDTRSGAFLHRISHSESRSALLAPLSEYNNFAARFDCNVYPPDKTRWKFNYTLNDGTTLRVWGLTSTFLSGPDDAERTLYMSPWQTTFERKPGVVHVALAHHPPEWLIDRDEVDDALRNGATIQLLGHRHRQRIEQLDTHIRIAAAAVNPERNEPGWEPGYNVIELQVQEEGDTKYLNVETHIRIWQGSPDLFRAKLTPERQEVFTKRIRLGPTATWNRASSRASTCAEVQPPSNLTPDDTTRMASSEGEPIVSNIDPRDLLFRFWNNLDRIQRRDVMLDLGLLDEAELALGEPERYDIAFNRARTRGLLEKLAEEIKAMENK